MCMWTNFHGKTLPFFFFPRSPSLCIVAVNYCMRKYIFGNRGGVLTNLFLVQETKEGFGLMRWVEQAILRKRIAN